MNHKKGVITIVLVLTIGTLILGFGAGAVLRSIGNLKMSVDENQYMQAKALAEGCVEYALFKLQSELDYSGGETIILDDESCTVVSISGNGNSNRTIRATSTVHEQNYAIEVEVGTISPTASIISWKSTPTF